MVNKLKVKLFSQSGVMFGIDARVTLLVTAIAAFIVGTSYLNNTIRDNEEIAADDLQIIKTGFLNYFEDYYTIPNTATFVTDLKSYVYLEDDGSYDPWGIDYKVQYVTNTETVLGVSTDINYFIISSYGPDRVDDTPSISTYADYLAATSFNDDIYLKFNTKKVEEKLIAQEKSQLNIVKSLLNNYVREKHIENALYCDTPANQLSADCDVNSDGVYVENEESMLNYTPQEYDETAGQYYITTNVGYGTPNVFKSGYINTSTQPENNMYTFIDLIGGGSFLVKSPRNFILRFNSNIYSNTQSPYFAEIWYGPEVTSI